MGLLPPRMPKLLTGEKGLIGMPYSCEGNDKYTLYSLYPYVLLIFLVVLLYE